jgi:cell division protein FtsB
MQEILTNEGGTTPVFNTYAVEIGESLWRAIYDYIWAIGHDEEYCPLYSIDGIFEEGTQKFAILRDRKNLTYHRLNFSIDEANGFVPAVALEAVAPEYKPLEEPQFALDAVEAFETEYVAKKKEDEEKEKEPADGKKPEEGEKSGEDAPADEEEPEDDKKKKKNYNLEEVVEYTELQTEHENLQNSYNELSKTHEELQTKFAELTESVNQLNAQIEQLTNDNKDLTDYKLQREREKKESLIKDTFYMLSDEQKKDCLDNIDTYSLEEIEAKLSVICVRNKVSFDLDKPEEEKKPITYNIDHVEDDIDNSLPAWIQRVKEVAKENNI